MYDGSVISDNNGLGIFLLGDGQIVMNDGSAISDNSSGGISLYVYGGNLTMNGSSSLSRNNYFGVHGYSDGSVKCTVTMNGNSVIGGFQQSDGNIGPGVYFFGGGPHTLMMKDNAAIAYNDSGVVVNSNTSNNAKTITMEGNAVIRNNTTTSTRSGGINIVSKTNITLSGNAKIEGNRSTGTGSYAGGGGIRFDVMGTSAGASVLRILGNNAEISHNSTAGKGGGVYKGPQSNQMMIFTEGTGRVSENNYAAQGNNKIFP
jgi:hypothetical protein